VELMVSFHQKKAMRPVIVVMELTMTEVVKPTEMTLIVIQIQVFGKVMIPLVPRQIEITTRPEGSPEELL
jgi:hypothetical protein